MNPNDHYSLDEIVILDTEASGLDHDLSYPIELAWASLSGESDSFLINPNTAKGWTHWCEDAENVHNISRALCCSKGISTIDACIRLNSQLNGCLVLSDATDDSMWVNTLFKATDMQPNFVMVDIRQYSLLNKHDSEVMDDFIKMKRNSVVLHRALEDCLQIVEIGRQVGLFPNK